MQRTAQDQKTAQRRGPDGKQVERSVAEQVQRSGAEQLQPTATEEVQSAPTDRPTVQTVRQDRSRTPAITARTAATIASPGHGAPIAGSVRSSIEPHLGADLGGVRVHTGPDAAHAATSLGARAFTVGSDIYLGRGESPLDVSLMGHESTHVVQQGGGAPMAARLAAPEQAQLLPELISTRLADYARHVPGYTLLTVIIRYDPLLGTVVERTPMTLVEGLMGLVPGGTFVFDELRDLGILQAAFDYIEAQLATFDLSLERLERTIEQAWDEMDFARLDPFDYNLGVLARHAERLLDDVRGFASAVLHHVMDLIKEALLGVAEELLEENRAWALIKKILHRDPLRGTPVEATTVEILEDFLHLIGREQELEQMRTRGTLQKTADWLDTQVGTFLGLLGELSALFSAAWAVLQPANLPDLPSTLPALAQRAGAFLQRVWDFAVAVATQVIALIKDALLGWLSTFVDQLPGFNLLTVILGRNPITGATVPRTAVNIIRGFITLLPNGAAVYERLEQTGVIADAAARIEGAISELGISWDFIVGLFRGVWDTVVSIDTLIDPIGVFIRVRDQFGEPISRLVSFVATVLRTLFDLLLALMQFPTDLIGHIVEQAMQAYEQIRNDPIAFLLHLLEAVKLGFSNFFDHILTHLTSGLTEWLFRGLRQAGVEPPRDLSLSSILDTVLQVLGISVDRIWQKLAERFGQETIDRIRGAIDRISGIWTVVKDVQERGVGALWEYVQTQLANLWDTVIQTAKNWIMEQVVNRVVARLLSMLDPTGIMAVVNGFIAFFNAVQSAVEYLRDILQIIDMWVSTVASIAAGDVTPGAAKLEEGLAAAVPVAIGFLANQVGLGDIAVRIAEIIGRIRHVVDRALDWLLDRLAAMVNSVLAMIRGGGAETAEGGAFRFHEDVMTAGEEHELDNRGDSFELTMSSKNRSLLSSHPSKKVRTAYQAYLKAIADAPSPSEKKKAANRTVADVIDEVKAAGSPDAPRASAPGIGAVASHSAQQSRLHKSEIPVWAMESEHVIPRGFVDAAVTALGANGIPAAGPDYNAMRTVLIYRGAADRKTEGDSGDASLWNAFSTDATRAIRAAVSEPDTSVSLLRAAHMIREHLEAFSHNALLRTYVAIIEENEEHGEARGPVGQPEPPTPGKSRVDEAFARQLDDIGRILEDRMTP
ncbi:uncharacterized protein DUF4157 [Humibacillus xanthopallidus]|uniref:Uncharacterized protein DUF4157 n=1 Tax=Humibacillus xanthopallidus TaxID=412689 RepID=A0A543PWW4_9MICO|nr:DUF4157 domain-containing protein [Humibacillus xanthopallidus]TQN48572.1 uncharacterized protein DUF4157 [Humibacillus xanthopallidus]